MKPNAAFASLGAVLLIGAVVTFADANLFRNDNNAQIVKMCLFYDRPSGHARSDPIISQECASDHVHTFYGPRDIHPNTSYEDLLGTKAEYSTSPFEENKSLYWHPSIYRVEENDDGTETFHLVSNLYTSPYYRWDKTVTPEVEAFPPGFRMIAANTDPGSDQGGELGFNMFTECCSYINAEENCDDWNKLFFPRKNCDFLSIAFNMPTCWNGELGDENDHKDHMRYTLDGRVGGECPDGFNRRLPQVQPFVRIMNYKGKKYRYQLSDEQGEVWHVDFFNGWEEGKLQEIIDNCPEPDCTDTGFNPPCRCADEFLTPNQKVAKTMCEDDVRRLIIDEAIIKTDSLPRGTCQGSAVIDKSWDDLSDDLFGCTGGSCEERKSDKFFQKPRDGSFFSEKKRTCGWLQRKKSKGKNWRRTCKWETGTGGYDPRIVCPVTCESCD